MIQTRITIYPQYLKYISFINSIHDNFDHEGKTVFKGRDVIKVFEVNGLSFHVKRYEVPSLPKRLAYTFIRPPKAKRAYRHAVELLSKNVCTSGPVAAILLYKDRLLYYSYYISLQS